MGFETVETYHPLFAYEAVLNFVNLLLLLWLARRFADTLKTGDLFFAYLGTYSFVRLLLEFLRLDVSLIYGINVNQVFFASVFICAGFYLYWRHRPT